MASMLASEPITVAVGLNKNPSDKNQDPNVTVKREGAVLLQWVEQKSNDAFGTAVVIPGAEGFAQDNLNELILARATSGKPLRYYAGGAWSRAGEITSLAQWQKYLQDAAARAGNPVRVTLARQQ